MSDDFLAGSGTLNEMDIGLDEIEELGCGMLEDVQKSSIIHIDV